MQTKSTGGYNYVVYFVDSFSRYVFVQFLRDSGVDLPVWIPLGVWVGGQN